MGTREKEGVDPEGLQELLELLDSVSKIDLSVEVPEQQPNDKLIEALRSNRTIRRGVKGKGLKLKKLHWKTKASRRKNYLHTIHYPRMKARLAEQLTTGEGWYSYLVTGWKRHKQDYRLTREEFLQHIYPRLNGRVPVFYRYSLKKPISLENVYVLGEDRSVLWDGAEYRLIRLGYCLPSIADSSEDTEQQSVRASG